MPEIITYPTFIESDQERLCAVYSLLEQMRLEHNRQHDIYTSEPEKYWGNWLAYIKLFRKKQLPLLREQSRLRGAIRRSHYDDVAWQNVIGDDPSNYDILEQIWGDKEVEKVKPTLASTDLLDQLKSIDLATLDKAPFVDPIEDFTTYTENDDAGRYTVISNKVTITEQNNGSDNDDYVYDDKGVDHFGNFEHLCQIHVPAGGDENAYLFLWALANAVGDYKQSPALYLFLQHKGTYPRIYVLEAQTSSTDSYNGSFDTDYYLTIARSDTTFTCEIRTGSHTGTLQETLTFTCQAPGAVSYRYIYACESWGDGIDGVLSASIQDLDLQEGVTEKSSSDSGTGAESKASNNPLATFSKSEAGSGVDAVLGLAIFLAVGDGGNGVDVHTDLIGTLITGESGSGVEQSLLSLLLSSSESGSGSETVVSLLAELLRGDSGSGSEHILGRNLLLPDSGAGADSRLDLCASFLGSETGSGVEQSLLSIITAKFSSETGSGMEVASLIELLVSSDAGIGSDLRKLMKDILGSDGGTGCEDLKALVAAAGSSMRLPDRQGHVPKPSGQVRKPFKGVNI